MKERLIKAGLDTVAGGIESLVLPSLKLIREKVGEDEIARGASKIGGRPDLAAGLNWPEWQGTLLSFIAQINLGDVVAHISLPELPRAGLLSFFYDAEQSTWGFDPKDAGSWKVFYFEDESLIRTEPPASLPSHGRFEACRLSFEEETSLPSLDSICMDRLQLSDEEKNAYFSFCYDSEEKGPRHQMFGHPYQIQGEMQLECQLVSKGIYCGSPEGYANPRCAELEAGADEWMLLLQIDSDDDAGMMWGDMGCIYFWIRKQSLKHLRFDQTWMILQCS
jgi:uncharacterized protein YwqG